MESESIIEVMAVLILQLGIVLFAVRFFGSLVAKLGIPHVLGELVAGIIIGPYALGGLKLPGFEHGIFPLREGFPVVSVELYAFATVAAVILLFSSGLETNLRLFLRYSFAGGIISLGGVLLSFVVGDMVGMFFFKANFMDPLCLFLGLLIASNSLGIVARLLSEQKKMDSPEGVTILAASIFDDVFAIILLAIVGIFAVATGGSGQGLDLLYIGGVAGKVLVIWLGFTALGLLLSKKLAFAFKLFRSNYDFSMLSLGLGLILAGVFEHLGLAMIIGAYVAGLSLSRTDIAPVVQERIHGLYEFFVPIFFAVTGMMVDFRQIIEPHVLLFGGLYALAAILAKMLGCGGPALLLGFNVRGALRVGLGMSPRGEMTLILAGIGLAWKVLDHSIFAELVLMVLVTTLAVPPLLNAMLKLSGRGTRKPTKDLDTVSLTWDFPSTKITDLVVNTLLDDLRAEGFYVQMMNRSEGICQARKDDISLSIQERENKVIVKTAKDDAHFVKTVVYEVIVELYEYIGKLRESSDPRDMKKSLLDGASRTRQDLLSFIQPECACVELRGRNKIEIITELVDLLHARGKLRDRATVLADVLEREDATSTGMEHGIALPHAKTDGVDDMEVAVGIKKEGVEFASMDGVKSSLFILIVSPKRTTGPHIQFLATISALLRDAELRGKLTAAATPEDAVALLRAEK